MKQLYFLDAQAVDQIARRIVQVQQEDLEALESLPFRPWMKDFLRDLERTSASLAIELCPYSRDSVYRHKRRCPAFRQQWESITEAKKAASGGSGRRRPSALAKNAPVRPAEQDPLGAVQHLKG